MMLVFWVGLGGGRGRRHRAVRLVSFFILREFISLSPTRRGDHRSLVLAFFIVLPLQYALVWTATSTCSPCSSRSTCSWPFRW
jgi:phosphatidate cytidylyltransferase